MIYIKLWQRISEEELKIIWEKCTTYEQVLKEIGYKSWSSSANKEIKQKYSWYRYNNLENLVGKTFGELTVIEQAEGKHQQRYWICKCSCGQITKPIPTCHLKSGHTKSCGHLQFNNLLGQKFNKLTVINDVKNSYKSKYWLCKCDCGNIVTVRGDHLINNEIKSCGCERSFGEAIIEKCLKENNYSYEKEYSFNELKGNNYTLRFDFAIFKDSQIFCLIEYQGAQHYKSVDYFGGDAAFEKRKNYDELKRQYCRDNSIKLIEIPYWEYNKITPLFIKEKIEA